MLILGSGCAQVRYADGDREELTLHELMAVIVPEAEPPASGRKRHRSLAAAGPRTPNANRAASPKAAPARQAKPPIKRGAPRLPVLLLPGLAASVERHKAKFSANHRQYFGAAIWRPRTLRIMVNALAANR